MQSRSDYPGEQLGLSMWLRESATFDNFVPGSNTLLLNAVKEIALQQGERFLYFWGPDGEGKSHLLQAACHEAASRGETSVYLPLSEAGLAPEMLEGLEQMALVAIDDIDRIAGDAVWEEALFHLYNRIREQQDAVLLVAGQEPLSGLGLKLADLQSRLAWGLVFQLQVLSDEQKLQALQQRARARNFDLSDEVGNYLMRHCRRDMAGLFELLEQLDKASLAEQRRVTVPFVKEVIGKVLDETGR